MSKKHHQFQITILDAEAKRYQLNAAAMAEQYGMAIEDVRELIQEWQTDQKELLEIELLKSTESVARGFQAAGMQIKREMKTWGEKAWEFSMSFQSSIASGLENTMRNFKDWKTQLLSMFEEIYWSAVRIAFIQPAAGWLAAGMTAAIGAVLPAPTAGVPSVTSPTYGQPMPALQRGGTVERTGLAVIHKGETVTPAGGGNVSVHIHNEGAPVEITKEHSYMLGDQRIIDVVIRAAGTHGGYRRSIQTTARG